MSFAKKLHSNSGDQTRRTSLFNMSFLNIQNHEKRDKTVKEYLSLKKRLKNRNKQEKSDIIDYQREYTFYRSRDDVKYCVASLPSWVVLELKTWRQPIRMADVKFLIPKLFKMVAKLRNIWRQRETGKRCITTNYNISRQFTTIYAFYDNLVNKNETFFARW